MAFIGKLKSMFGFSDENYEDEENELHRDATVTPLSTRRIQEQDDTRSVYSPDAASTPSNDESLGAKDESAAESSHVCPEQIFRSVVEIFNESLPQFMKSSVDPQKQAEYIYNALDQSMQEYIAQLRNDADKRVHSSWEVERVRLRNEMEELREKTRKIEEASNEWKEQKLSAERQKRALSERVHDLEKQIDAFQAEKEQYELENKTLVNKVRVMQVQDGDNEALRNENMALRKELLELKTNAGQTVVPAVDQETLKRLDELTARADDLAAEKEDLTRQRDSLANDIVVLKKRCEISDAMINDLNQKASAAREALNQRESQLQEELSHCQDALKQAKEALAVSEADNTGDDLRSENEALKAQIETVQTESKGYADSLANTRQELERVSADLHNATVEHDATVASLNQKLNDALEEVEESRSSLAAFEQSLLKIEENNRARQNRIAELQSSVTERDRQISENDKKLADAQAAIAERDAQIVSLQATIENNLKLQASSEAMLRSEIENLRRPTDSGRGRPKKTPKVTSIDDSLDDTDWLISIPPKGTNARPSSISDADFGYQEPPKRRGDDNPAQMSLW